MDQGSDFREWKHEISYTLDIDEEYITQMEVFFLKFHMQFITSHVRGRGNVFVESVRLCVCVCVSVSVCVCVCLCVSVQVVTFE